MLFKAALIVLLVTQTIMALIRCTMMENTQTHLNNLKRMYDSRNFKLLLATYSIVGLIISFISSFVLVQAMLAISIATYVVFPYQRRAS